MAKKDSGGQMKPRDIQNLIDMQTRANRVNQQTPYGSLTYSGNTANVALTPQQQQLLEQTQAAQLAAGGFGAERLAGLGGSGAGVEKATFDRAMALLNPEFDRRENQLLQRLSNQGLPQSSGAFNREVGRFETGRNQAAEQAALAAVLAGDQAQTSELNRIMGLLGLGQPAQPQFVNVPQIDVPFNQPQAGGGSPLTGALAGAAGLAPLGPYGAAAGGLLGLMAGM